MKTILVGAMALALLGASTASAQSGPYGDHHGPGMMQGDHHRMDGHHDGYHGRRHHHHMVCRYRHHHRVCHATNW